MLSNDFTQDFLSGVTWAALRETLPENVAGVVQPAYQNPYPYL